MNNDPLILKSFTGTKTIEACEMMRKQAEVFMQRKVYADSDEREDELGYLVKYPDGYFSWSPKKVFEEAYRVSETYIDRMVIERKEVKERYLAGRDFTFSDKFESLDEVERSMLKKQLDAMEGYLYILNKRIANAINKGDEKNISRS